LSVQEINELQQLEEKRELMKIEGKAKHIEINERSLQEYKKAFADKGLVVESKDYPAEDFALVSKQKEFDSLVDPSQGIRKVIISMVRQPVTVFDKSGKPTVKDALYFSGYYYGTDKHGRDLGAEFHEGSYKKPKLSFTYTDAANPYDSKTGERRGDYKVTGFTYQYYIFLPEKQADRVKFLNDLVQKSTGTSIGNLSTGGHLAYRNPSPNNDRSGGHGGAFTFKMFSELSIEELGECQNKNYYKEKSTGMLKDRDGVRVKYNDNTGKLDAVK
jgi:hypothetical protein